LPQEGQSFLIDSNFLSDLPYKLLAMTSLRGRKPLSETHPDLCREISVGDPTKFSAGSDQKFEWVCSKNHKWEASIGNRALRGTGCPDCAKINRNPTYGSLLGRDFPEIASEAHGWDPSKVASTSKIKKSWKCSKGHEFESRPQDRTKRNHGCPYCSGRRILPGFNDLATIDPNVASELIDADPSTVSPYSNKKVKFRCPQGHIYEASTYNRVRNKSGCGYCSGLNALAGFNDLKTTHPELASEAYGWDPTTVRAGTHKKLTWRCSLGHIFTASGEARLIETGNGCRVCGRSQLLKGYNDLATTHPEIASQADGWDPTEFVSGNNSKRKWKCSSGHTYEAPIIARTNTHKGEGRAAKGTDCPICAGKKALKGFNDLGTTHPEIANQAYEWDPESVTAGSNKKKDWICQLGHIWKAAINNRTSQNLGCPICSNQQVLAGFNDLLTTNPALALEAHLWDPSTVTQGANVKRRWKCLEGHTWDALVVNRSGRGDGCPSCAQSGYDPNKDGWLYFLSHPNWEMLQIGITNVPDDRLGSHKRLGWEVSELRGPMDGHLTQQLETAILRMLKANGADLSNSSIAGKFDGYSEAWSKSHFEAKSLRHLMDLTDAHEETLKKKKKQ
jgi:hypothetical protein